MIHQMSHYSDKMLREKSISSISRTDHENYSSKKLQFIYFIFSYYPYFHTQVSLSGEHLSNGRLLYSAVCGIRMNYHREDAPHFTANQTAS